METPPEAWLTQTLQNWSADGAGGMERLSQRVLGIETAVSEILGAPAYDRRGAIRGPDLVITNTGRVPIAIELKVLGSGIKNVASRVADLLAAAVETRRAFRDPVVLGAILLGTGEPSVDALSRSVPRLLRNLDGVGYDLVVVGYADGTMRWIPIFAGSDGGGEPIEQQISSTAPVDSDTIAGIFRSLAPVRDEPADRKSLQRQLKRRVLLVADEWRSGLGGISTVNRELAIAMSAAGCDVVVMVPTSTDEDAKSASDVEVELVTPARVPGLSDHALLTLRPILPVQGWEPDFIVGHGRILGPYAAAQQQEFFPQARRLHFVHMAAEQLEAAKRTAENPLHMMRADERRALERDLAQSANLVVGIGPLLADSISDDLISEGQRPPVVRLVPGLREGYVGGPDDVPVRNSILIVGRADDFHSKGIDIAAEALLKVRSGWGPRLHPPHLVLRGVPEEAEGKVAERLDSIFEGAVHYDLRPYSNSVEEIVRDLAQAKIVLMPSRHEGFGLAAYEVIASAIPVLLSDNSGLAMFLRQHQLDTSPSSILPVVAVPNDRPVTDVWADAISELLREPEKARQRATDLRLRVSNVVSWRQTVETLLAAVDQLG